MSGLAVITRDVTDEAGNLLDGAQVTIRVGHDSGGALAAIYADEAGGAAIANPVTLDGLSDGSPAAGQLQVYAEPGLYRLEGTGAAGVGFSVVDTTSLGWAGSTYESRAAALAASPLAVIVTIAVKAPNGDTLVYKRDAEGAALTTADGSNWSPDGDIMVQHYGWDQSLSNAMQTAVFQATIDSLPEIGGTIHLAAETYDITPASLTVDPSKMLRWEIDEDGVLPEGMPGSVITRGDRDMPYTSGVATGFNGQRPGNHENITISNHVVKGGVPNQEDSIYYIEGHLDLPSAGLDTEYAGLRINMSAADATEPGAALRGIHLSTTGDGGSAKLRSIRATSKGVNGHDGLVTGGMISAVRSGIIPISAGGDGVAVYASGDAGPYPNQDAGIISQVGPGIRTAIRAEGFAGKERPQVVFQQSFGNQALLPENAAVQLHGGGNGRVMEVFTDEDGGAMIAAIGKIGDFTSQAMRGSYESIEIASDAAVQIPLARTGGFLFVYSPGSTTFWSISFVRAISGSSGNASIAVGSGMDLSTGVLTGTTGTDGRCTASVDGQSFWIENRAPATRNFVWALIG